jgi:hypothetical protein
VHDIHEMTTVDSAESSVVSLPPGNGKRKAPEDDYRKRILTVQGMYIVVMHVVRGESVYNALCVGNFVIKFIKYTHINVFAITASVCCALYMRARCDV